MHADATVSDLEKTIEGVSSSLTWMRYRIFSLPFLVLWLSPLILFFGWQYWWHLAAAWSLLAVMIFFAIIKPFWLEKKADARCQRLLVREYEAQWRPRLFRYVQATHAPSQRSIEQLRQSASELGQGQIIDVVLSYAFGDRAIHLFSQTQLFVH